MTDRIGIFLGEGGRLFLDSDALIQSSPSGQDVSHPLTTVRRVRVFRLLGAAVLHLEFADGTQLGTNSSLANEHAASDGHLVPFRRFMDRLHQALAGQPGVSFQSGYSKLFGLWLAIMLGLLLVAGMCAYVLAMQLTRPSYEFQMWAGILIAGVGGLVMLPMVIGSYPRHYRPDAPPDGLLPPE